MGTHNDNFGWWDDKINLVLDALSKCRKPAPHLHSLSRIYDQLETYCNWFKIDIPNHIKIKLNVASTADAKETIANAKKLEAERFQNEHKHELKMFRSGKMRRMSMRDGYDYIRVDEKRFITSQGVEIPHAIGLKFYELLKAGKVVAGDKLMEYTIGGITKDVVEIGCHRITFKEMKRAVSSKTLQLNK
jgi:hypothetical protein